MSLLRFKIISNITYRIDAVDKDVDATLALILN